MTSRLEEFRDRIDHLDAQIVQLLAERLEICAEVGAYKREEGLAVMQPDRVEQVKARCADLASAHGLRPEFARSIYGVIIQEACELEDRILARGKGSK